MISLKIVTIEIGPKASNSDLIQTKRLNFLENNHCGKLINKRLLSPPTNKSILICLMNEKKNAVSADESSSKFKENDSH